VREARCGSHTALPSKVVADWLASATNSLLAIDAPLGWPVDLATSLLHHEAGGDLPTAADLLFHRQTDAEIERRLGKRPLEIGANLIARTAHAALSFLVEVRRLSRMPVPLAWSPSSSAGPRAIEVYPAATLRAHGIQAGEYKRTSELDGRRGLLGRLGARVTLPENRQVLEDSADALDAVVCLIAGADFLEGRAVPPTDLVQARKEGWIWAPMPAETQSGHAVDDSERRDPGVRTRTPAVDPLIARPRRGERGTPRSGSRSGGRPTTKTGFENRNRQTVVRSTGLPGSDHAQSIYVLRCGHCELTYGANGSDIFQRRCPNCQGGAAGLAY
jgi:Protein of unknown function (DUF429)